MDLIDQPGRAQLTIGGRAEPPLQSPLGGDDGRVRQEPRWVAGLLLLLLLFGTLAGLLGLLTLFLLQPRLRG
jgi:hypothetical protein